MNRICPYFVHFLQEFPGQQFFFQVRMVDLMKEPGGAS